MDTTQEASAFAEDNQHQGLSEVQLREFERLAGPSNAQPALDFVVSLLQQNDKPKVKLVLRAARAALKTPNFPHGVHEVFAAAQMERFPQPDALIGYRMILAACEYACDQIGSNQPAVVLQ